MKAVSISLLALAGLCEARNLFREAPTLLQIDAEMDITLPLFSPINPDTVVQQTWVKFDFDAFRSRAEEALVFNLGDGAEASVITRFAECDKDNIWMWRADLVSRENDTTALPSSLVVSMVDGKQLNGHAIVGDRRFTFHSGEEYTRVTETDQSRYPPETEPVDEIIPETTEPPVNSSLGIFKQQHTISILVLIPGSTQQECNRMQNNGQLPPLRTLYQNHMSYVWTQQYGVGARVSVACIVYTSNGDTNSDLFFLRGSSAARQLRDQYAADLVTMMVTSGNYCGIGYLPSLPVTPRNSNACWTVVRSDCAIDNWSWAHELGHNMGLHHDRYVTNSNGPGVCNHGGFAPNDANPTTRSIMAYRDRCSQLGRRCTRVGSYSDGNRLGRPCRTNTGETNVVYWRDAVPVVANYR